MLTSPFTPIPKESAVWSPAVKALLTDGMITLINKSPTLTQHIKRMSSYHSSAINGAL